MRLRALAVFTLAAPLIPHLAGQSVISTRAGLINYSEGLVFLDGHPVARKFGAFERLRNGSTLATQSGRAEVLLTPNTYLRIGENSSIRMTSDNLSDPEVEMLTGSASLDSEAAAQSGVVKLTLSDAAIRFLKPGRYRIDADPPQLRVFAGEAEVKRNGEATNVESSQLMPLNGAPIVKRFTDGADGLLDIWADERHDLIAGNLQNSQSITDPLLDNGSGDPGDLASLGAYGGYIPLASLPPVTGSGYYGYNPYGYNPYGYSSYGYGLYASNPAYLILRPTSSRVLTVYGLRTGTTSTFGFHPTSGAVNVPRPVVFAPRPAGPTSVHVGVRAGGHR